MVSNLGCFNTSKTSKMSGKRTVEPFRRPVQSIFFSAFLACDINRSVEPWNRKPKSSAHAVIHSPVLKVILHVPANSSLAHCLPPLSLFLFRRKRKKDRNQTKWSVVTAGTLTKQSVASGGMTLMLSCLHTASCLTLPLNLYVSPFSNWLLWNQLFQAESLLWRSTQMFSSGKH